MIKIFEDLRREFDKNVCKQSPVEWTEIKTFVNKVCKKYPKECGQEVPGWDRQVKSIDELQQYGN